MRHSAPSAIRRLVLIGAALGCAGCCGQRPNVLCVMPRAATIVVIDGAGNAVPGAFVRVSGPVLGSFCRPGSDASVCELACNEGRCDVFGHSGTYHLEVGAPGFQSQRTSITVRDTTGRCDPCESVAAANIRIALTS
jgi:hypothetical protein